MIVTKYYISFLVHLKNNSTDILQFINSRTDGYVIVKFFYGHNRLVAGLHSIMFVLVHIGY